MHRAFLLVWLVFRLPAAETVTRPFVGVTLIHRTQTEPRPVSLHVVRIDLRAPGLSFLLTPPAPEGYRETLRQTTLEFLNQEHAQIGINVHFFTPYPSRDPDADVIGIASSNGLIYSDFESPSQSYALVANAPGLNLDPEHNASIIHWNPGDRHHQPLIEDVTLWNTVAGSAQVITNGVVTIPFYKDEEHSEGQLTPGGPSNYSNAKSWYEVAAARTLIGLSKDNRALFLFTVDNAASSKGLSVSEGAEILRRDYGVHNALNLDGGGSTTLVMKNPETHTGEMLNVSSDSSSGRRVASSLLVFARSN